MLLKSSSFRFSCIPAFLKRRQLPKVSSTSALSFLSWVNKLLHKNVLQPRSDMWKYLMPVVCWVCQLPCVKSDKLYKRHHVQFDETGGLLLQLLMVSADGWVQKTFWGAGCVHISLAECARCTMPSSVIKTRLTISAHSDLPSSWP